MSWDDDAACVGMPREMFFPGPGRVHPSNDWRPVCGRCPVQQQCLDRQMAFEAGMHWTTRQGVFGNTTPKERWEIEKGLAEL